MLQDITCSLGHLGCLLLGQDGLDEGGIVGRPLF
jgi:hypothetical protein